MNSGLPVSTRDVENCDRASRPILVLTTVYLALLASAGTLMWTVLGFGSLFLLLPVIVFPALIYAIAIFVYGQDLLGKKGLAQRARAWLRLLSIAVLLYSTICATTVVVDTLPNEPGDTSIQPLAYHVVIVMAIVLLGLWAYIGRTAFVPNGPPLFHSKPALATKLLGVLLLMGSFMMISSLALNVGYLCTGWSVLTWQGGWVTNAFIEIDALRAWLNGLTLAGYAAGLVLALLAIAAGVIMLTRNPVTAKNVSRLSNAIMSSAGL